MARFGSLGTQYFDNSGKPLSGGFINFYESGTTTRKNTYSDINLTTENENPVELDASGRQPNIFFAGVAKGVLTTSTGVIIETRDPLGDDNFGAAFSDWNALYSYSENNITYYGGEYYASLIDDNIGNVPSSSPSEWEILADNLLGRQTDIEPGHIPVGGTTEGFISLNTKTKGTIPAGNGTTTTTLAVGTNGQVLAANSSTATGLEWQSVNAAGSWILLSTVTASASATVDIETTFDSTYDVYVIVANNVLPATNEALLWCRLKIDGAYKATDYVGSSVSLTSASATPAATLYTVASPANQILISQNAGLTNEAYGGIRFAMNVFDVTSTATRKQVTWDGSDIARTSNQFQNSRILGAARYEGGNEALTGVRFLMSTGNISTGTFRLYGIKKA